MLVLVNLVAEGHCVQGAPDVLADRSTCLQLLHEWICAMLESSGRNLAAFFTQVLRAPLAASPMGWPVSMHAKLEGKSIKY